MITYDELHDRLVALKAQNLGQLEDRWRIRSILDGGTQGIYAVMAWNQGKGASMTNMLNEVEELYGVDLPTVNMMDSGLTRLAQRVGRLPTLKPPKSQGETVIEGHQKRIDLLRDWDRQSRINLQAPQMGRWLPGYGFGMWTMTQRRGDDGKLFPVMELRDPYDVYVGWLGPDQHPKEYATVRRIPLEELEGLLTDKGSVRKIEERLRDQTIGMSFSALGVRSWEGMNSGVEVVELHTADAKVICVPEAEMVLEEIPNPISVPTFNFVKRYSFNKLVSQYHHIIGVMAMMTKLSILSLIAIEDSTFLETNIEGTLSSGRYKMGRGQVNILTPGSKVTRPYAGNQIQQFQQIDRLERQLRIGAQYDVQQDGQSPNSFATGMGMRELQASVNDNVSEYHLVLRAAAERNDELRYRWAYELYRGEKRQYFDMRGKKRVADITAVVGGDFRTRRVYGAMASFDDSSKILVGMQLETGGYMDKLTFQENIDGLEDLDVINERITRAEWKEMLKQLLLAESEQNPQAKELMVAIMKDPDREMELLEEFFGPPDEEEIAAQQQAMAAQQQAAQQGAPVGVGGPPVGAGGGEENQIQSVLSRITGSGEPQGGVQSVVTQ